MRIGVVFPQTEIGGDAGAVRAYAEPVEALGYQPHARLRPRARRRSRGAHAAGPARTTCTPRSTSRSCCSATSPPSRELELVTGIIILPQRQTALVAKQAAEVDLLTGGRFRLGVGIGWNAVEYEALGKDFTDRGRRSEEQIELLRRLWTEPVVTYDGPYERITAAGLAPLPVQRPIPIWFGVVVAPRLRAGRPPG